MNVGLDGTAAGPPPDPAMIAALRPLLLTARPGFSPVAITMMTTSSRRMIPPAPATIIIVLRSIPRGASGASACCAGLVSRWLARPLLATMFASSSSPLPDPPSASPRPAFFFLYSVLALLLPEVVEALTVACSPLADCFRCFGTVWIVPQYRQRQTPPANASSIWSSALQLLQLI